MALQTTSRGSFLQSRAWRNLWKTWSQVLRPRLKPRTARQLIAQPEGLELRFLLTTYDVGVGLEYTSIGAVPWDDLQAGDTVNIHYRAEPYHEMIFLSGHGTAEAPIRVQGIAGPNGERPVIDGQNAVIGPNLNYPFSGLPMRGLISVSLDNDDDYGVKPEYIEIIGLAVRNAHLGNSFIRPGNVTTAYAANAAGIYIERGENITIRDCEIDHNSNGFFVASGDEEALQSREILVQGNYIHDNGNLGSDRQHNVYTEAIGITFEDNHFAPLLPGSGGANLKDRSAGTIIRNNWIEGGAYLMDLVDPEGSSNQAVADPRFQKTFVYGNVLLDTAGPGNASNLIHYGGDSGDESIYRKGTLYFYQNTVVIQGRRTGPNARYFTDVFRFNTNQQIADIRNNIFYATGDPAAPQEEPTGFAFFDYIGGTAHFEANWVSPDWHLWRNDDAPSGANITGTSNFITNAQNDPGFSDLSTYDFRLTSSSDAIDQSVAFPAAVTGNQEPTRQYVVHQGHSERILQGEALDFGAFEGAAAVGPGLLQFQFSTQSVSEDAGVAHIIVRRSGGTLGAVTVHFTTVSGTAQAGSEFESTSGTLQFADGQTTAQIDVTILDNVFSGPNKSLQLQLSNPTDGATLGATTTLGLTIQNDEPEVPGSSSVRLTETRYAVTVSSGQMVVTLTRDGDLSGVGEIRIATQAKSAKAGVNFVALSQTVQFAPGQASQQVTIQILNHPIGKGKKIFKVLLSNEDGVTLNRKDRKGAKVTLTDD